MSQPAEPDPSAEQPTSQPSGSDLPQPGPGQPHGATGQPQASSGQQPPGPGQQSAWPGQPQYGPSQWQYGPGQPPGGLGFDPADPLVSPDYAGWWQRGTAVTRAGWRPLARLQLIIVVPTMMLLIPAQIFTQLEQRAVSREAASGATPQVGPLLAVVGILLLTLVPVLLIYVIGTMASARMVVTVATGGPARIGPAVRSVLPRVPALIGWYLVAGLLSVAAFCACVLPLFYVLAVLLILPAVVAFERGGDIARCFRLFHADLGAAAGRVATIAALGLGLSLVVGALSTIVTLVTLGSAFPDPAAAAATGAVVADSVLGSLLTGLASVISGVILTPLMVATYADLRARHEPFSTAQLVAEPGH